MASGAVPYRLLNTTRSSRTADAGVDDLAQRLIGEVHESGRRGAGFGGHWFAMNGGGPPRPRPPPPPRGSLRAPDLAVDQVPTQ